MEEAGKKKWASVVLVVGDIGSIIMKLENYSLDID
jgi:hypothetical protein